MDNECDRDPLRTSLGAHHSPPEGVSSVGLDLSIQTERARYGSGLGDPSCRFAIRRSLLPVVRPLVWICSRLAPPEFMLHVSCHFYGQYKITYDLRNRKSGSGYRPKFAYVRNEVAYYCPIRNQDKTLRAAQDTGCLCCRISDMLQPSRILPASPPFGRCSGSTF